MNGNDPELSSQNLSEENPNPETDIQVSVDVGAVNKQEEREYDKMMVKAKTSIPPKHSFNHNKDMPEAGFGKLPAGHSNSSDDASGSPNKASMRNGKGRNTSEVCSPRERRSPSRPKSCDPPNSISVTISIRYPNDCQSDATQDLSLIEDRCPDVKCPPNPNLCEEDSSSSSEDVDCDQFPPELAPSKCRPKSMRTDEIMQELQSQRRSTKRKATSNLHQPTGRKHQWYTFGENRIYCHMKDETEDSPMYYLDYLSITDRCPNGACDLKPEENSEMKSVGLLDSVERSRNRRNTNTGNKNTGEGKADGPQPIGRRHQWYSHGNNRVFCHMKNKRNESPSYYLDYPNLTERCPSGKHCFKPEKQSPRSRSERRSTHRASQQRRSRTEEDNVNNPTPGRSKTGAKSHRFQSENRGAQGTKLEKRSKTTTGYRKKEYIIPIGRRR
ncbi:unnamed protein product [Rodentolepis nana]|uniref:Histone-lysine N-methyltransferase ASH1L n=1 Tax=Rodentolepis nana TaxID=102285 RepID=A0A0R3TB45_RODNA|nr:unnamed protein product [Rodentolepis nana]